MLIPNSIMIDDEKYIREESLNNFKKGPEVIIRTYSAGVHIGILSEPWEDVNKPILLKNARRLYRWRGANTLNEVASEGVNRNEYTRISKPIEEIQLIPIEVIPIYKNVDLAEVWND